MIHVALKGIDAAQAAHGADGDRDRPRRRADHRHLRPHRLDQGSVRRDLHPGLPRHRRHGDGQIGIHPQWSEQHDGAALLRDAAAQDPGLAGRRRCRRRCRRHCAPHRQREGRRLRRRPESRLQRRPHPAGAQQPDARRWEVAGPEPIGGRPGDRAEEGSARRADDRRAGKRADPADEDLRPRPLRWCGESRRRHALGLQPAHRTAALSAHREARRHPGESQAGRDAGAAGCRDPGHPAARHAGKDRSTAGEVGCEGHRELPQLPAGLPARVRRHRVVRRRVRDREHAVDHDQAAFPRARHAANARRVAPPGAILDRRRGLRDRHPRLGRRDLRRSRARRRPLQAVRPGGLHAAEQRTRPAHANRDRRSDRRDPRHRPGEPHPRLPRDAGAADRGRARRRRSCRRGDSTNSGPSARSC